MNKNYYYPETLGAAGTPVPTLSHVLFLRRTRAFLWFLVRQFNCPWHLNEL